jgi:hypothetical protein
VRVSYKFAAYHDGVHAGTDLALVWTKRLTDYINSNCFQTSAKSRFRTSRTRGGAKLSLNCLSWNFRHDQFEYSIY